MGVLEWDAVLYCVVPCRLSVVCHWNPHPEQGAGHVCIDQVRHMAC